MGKADDARLGGKLRRLFSSKATSERIKSAKFRNGEAEVAAPAGFSESSTSSKLFPEFRFSRLDALRGTSYRDQLMDESGVNANRESLDNAATTHDICPWWRYR